MRLLKGRNRNAAAGSGPSSVEFGSPNLILNSADFTTANWILSGSGPVVGNTTTAPDGTLTADSLTLAATTADFLRQRNSNLVALTTYTFSVWVWTDSGTKSFRLSRTNAATWVTGSITGVLTATTTPQRFSLTYTTLSGETVSDHLIGAEGKTPSSPTAGLYYLWGAQVQLGNLGPYHPVP